MNEQERYHQVVIKSLRDITPKDFQLAHDAIDATEKYCKVALIFAEDKMPALISLIDKEYKSVALEAINILKSNSTSLRLSYYTALLWLIGDGAINYDTIRYSLKEHYKLPWDDELEARLALVGIPKPDAQRRMEQAIEYDVVTLTLVGELMLDTYNVLQRISEGLK